MPSINPTTQRLQDLATKIASDKRIGFFERLGLKKTASAAIDSATSPAQVDEFVHAVQYGLGYSFEPNANYGLNGADDKKLALTAPLRHAAIDNLKVGQALKDALHDIVNERNFGPFDHHHVKVAFLHELETRTTVASAGDLYAQVTAILQDYHKAGPWKDAWSATPCNTAMAAATLRKQQSIDHTIDGNPRTGSPVIGPHAADGVVTWG